MLSTETREDVQQHIKHWRSEVLDAPTDARRQVAQRCLDNWLDQYLEMPEQRPCD